MGGQHSLYPSPSQQSQLPLSGRKCCFVRFRAWRYPRVRPLRFRGFSSRLACCCKRRCDARVRPQQLDCGGTSILLRPVQWSLTSLHQQGRIVGQAVRPQSHLCAPLTRVLARGSDPGVARRSATTWSLPLEAAACRGVTLYCRGRGRARGRKRDRDRKIEVM